MPNLIIVESPTKAKTLGRFLGKDYVVDSTMGHIRDLPKSKIGVDIEKNFEPTYIDDPKKADIVARLKKEVLKADKVYLATDPDREGEAIAWHVAEVLFPNGKWKMPASTQRGEADGKLSRVTFHEITESAVKDAMSHPRNIDNNLVDAQQARRVLDRLVGYKLSPLLWKKIRKGLSAGRVQSVAVRLIVDREREIEAFKPEEYWDIYSDVRCQTSNSEFRVKLIKIGEKPAIVSNKEQADKVVGDLEKASYQVSQIERKEVAKKPYGPFTTSTLTQAASRNFYWSAKKTMSVAQKLYEEGLITYHRTDSLNLSVQAISSARDYIGKEYGGQFLPEKPRIYKTSSKMAQEAHEAIRPTNIEIINAKLQITNAGTDAEKLYGLIWKRFVACQMADSIFDQTTIVVNADYSSNEMRSLSALSSRSKGSHPSGSNNNIYTLQVRGELMKFEGWKVLFKSVKMEEDETVQLPQVQDGENLSLIKVDPQQKFTEAPARFTEASLVKTLEKLGIGRPSTYAPTISTIQDRQYVEKNEGKFSPTSLGLAVNDFLVQYFKAELDFNFTAKMEGNLDAIAEGKEKWVPVIREFWDPFVKKLDGVEEKAKRVKIEFEKTGKKCPVCGKGDEVIRVGRFGKFLSCSLFPDCKYTAAYVETIAMKCPDCKTGDVVVKKTRSGKKFFGCSNYPTCKFASWKKPELPTIPPVAS